MKLNVTSVIQILQQRSSCPAVRPCICPNNTIPVISATSSQSTLSSSISSINPTTVIPATVATVI